MFSTVLLMELFRAGFLGRAASSTLSADPLGLLASRAVVVCQFIYIFSFSFHIYLATQGFQI